MDFIPVELLRVGFYLKSEGIIIVMQIISVLIYKMKDKTDCTDFPGISLFPASYSILSNNLLPCLTPLASEIIGASPE
jgi:hypothetical protein